MKDQFVPYELALKLKELGFDEECFAFYNGKDLDFKINDFGGTTYYQIDCNMDVGECIDAPLWQQVFDWFREKHNIHSYITSTSLGDFAVFITNNYDKHLISNNKLYNNAINCTYTYEEARQACLEKLIELCQ